MEDVNQASVLDGSRQYALAKAILAKTRREQLAAGEEVRVRNGSGVAKNARAFDAAGPIDVDNDAMFVDSKKELAKFGSGIESRQGAGQAPPSAGIEIGRFERCEEPKHDVETGGVGKIRTTPVTQGRSRSYRSCARMGLLRAFKREAHDAGGGTTRSPGRDYGCARLGGPAS